MTCRRLFQLASSNRRLRPGRPAVRSLAVLSGTVAVAIALLGPATAMAAPPHFDLRGDYTGTSAGGQFGGTSTITTMDFSTGAFSGTAAGGPYTRPHNGTLDGAAVTITDGPYDQLPSYTSTETGTVSPDGNHIDGTFHDTSNQTGDFHDTRSVTRRTTSTTVTCTAGACTATVTDTDTGSPSVPTSLVVFETTSGGSFPMGQECNLSPSAATAVATCAVAFTTSAGPAPTVNAYYVGDPQHNAGHGSTSTQKPSATSVQCDYDTFLQSFTCTAQVADASGNQPPQTPTGTVVFALDPGADGTFPSGSSCSLAPSQSGPTAYCSVTYLPGQQGVPAGTQPRLSATYPGDSTFSSSTAAPQNRYAPPPDTTPPPTTTTTTTATTTTATTTTATTTTTTTPTTPTTPTPPPHCVASRALLVHQHAVLAHASTLGRLHKVPPRRSLVFAGGHTPKHARTLTLAQANRRAITILRPARAPLTNGVALYGLAKPLRAGSVITEARLGFPTALLPALRIRERAWLYWENLGPLQRYTHPSIVLLIAARGGRILARARFATYPQTNGHAAPFITSHHPHALYRRTPGRHHPIKLTAAALRRLRMALAATKKPNGVNAALAHATDTNNNLLITLVDHQTTGLGQTFANEEHAITGVFASHGVPTQSTQGLSGLASAVDDASAAGRTTVTVFLDGHGMPDLLADTPTVLLGRTAGGVTAPDLVKIVQDHPDLKFNFIIDSCYSGRFVDPLSLEANVASVTTSSGATQQSGNPMILGYSSDQPLNDGPEFTVPNPRKLIDPTQPDTRSIYLNQDHDPNALSAFTTAEVAALKQAFIGKGSGADITAVIQDARTLEPTYDIAAAADLTDPSPDAFTPGATCGTPGENDPSQPDGWFVGA